MSDARSAPGQPGLPPRWTSSAKQGVGTAFGTGSPLWFTLSHGIVNEVYYPRVDLACTRDMGLIVTDGHDFFSEEKRHTRSTVEYLVEGVPAYRVTNYCLYGRYLIEKEILADPQRPVLLQHIRFRPQQGELDDYQLFCLLSPHLGNQGGNNTAWVGDYKGVSLLFARKDGIGMALACSAPWLARSVGYVGVSDGWQDLSVNRRLTWHYDWAEDGNVALTGQIDLAACRGECLLAVGFGQNVDEAAHRAVSSVLNGIEESRNTYLREWQQWQNSLLPLDDGIHVLGGQNGTPRTPGEPPPRQNVYRVSTAMIRTHEAKNFPGGLVASLSIPWGFSKGDNDLGGYHLVWPRDQVESAAGLMAAGAKAAACRVLRYLQVTQEADGHWGQNMWLDGTPYWNGIQMDEAALPVLLVDLAHREGMLHDGERGRLWPMVRHAAGYLVRNGPVTQQDRWEEDPGYSPFTLAAEIAALLVAAEMADEQGEFGEAEYLRETADLWHGNLDNWIYATDTELARRVGVDGYYVRIAPDSDDAPPVKGYVVIKNRPSDEAIEAAGDLVSPDALALVRFGLRAADDPRIVNTVKVIDAVLKVDLPAGPCWYRYNRDGYGEHADGSPFDGTGIGRAWPLLTGERAHFELAAGRRDDAVRLLRAFEQFSNCGGLLPEQVWDSDDLPDRELFRGQPAGSAMPLVWAHAEHIKLLRSLRDGKVFDMPPQTVERYLIQKEVSPHHAWRFNQKCRQMQAGKTLRIETLAPANVHWSFDEWQTTHDTATGDTGFGVYVADLPTRDLPSGATVVFTFYWPETSKWEGADFMVTVT